MRHLIPGKHAFIQTIIALVLAALLCAGFMALLNGQATAQEERPPSLLLIEEAYRRGELDYETALVYKVYTIFAPERLPAEFQSDAPGRGATLVLAEVNQNWKSISSQAQALLSEFITPPPAPGQVAIQALTRPAIIEEQTFTTTHFVIHYTITGTDQVYNPDVDTNPANGVPDYVDWVAEDLETVWSAEIGSMDWLEPPSDGSEGGDARYDVYLKNIPYYGYVDHDSGSLVGDNPNSPGVTETAAYYSYMVLENDFMAFSGDRRENIQVTVAHEFNHAIQVGYDGDEALWLMEATATWMEDEVYDDINDNYQFLEKWFLDPDFALEKSWYEYSRWLFMRYISEHHGGQATVRAIWEQSVTADNIEAIDAALAGDGFSFDAVFPRFVAANYALSSLPQNEPYTYEEADGYRAEVGSVEVEAYLPFTGTAVTYHSYSDGNEHYMEKHSAEYWAITTTTNLSLTFQGNTATEYAVQGALRQGNLVTFKQVLLTNQQGTLIVHNPAGYDEIVIAVANTGDVDETASYTLTLQTTTETPPTAVLSADPISGTIDTTFDFDASLSSDAQTSSSQLEIRWDWEGDALWDTEWSTTKTASHSFGQPGVYTVTVEVRDGVDLRDTATKNITVNNLSPTASFTIDPAHGNTNTIFTFDASGCEDDATPVAELEIKWDWENDGSWDTNWSTTKIVTHTFATASTYTVALLVRDDEGLEGGTSRTVQVLSSDDPYFYIYLPVVPSNHP